MKQHTSILAMAIREEKVIKGIQIGNDICYTQKILKMLPENYQSSSGNSVKLQDTKLIHRNLLNFCILTTEDQKEKLRKQFHLPSHQKGFPGGVSRKESTCQCRRHKRHSFDLGSGRSPGVGNDNPLQYSCLENCMDIGAWQGTVHGPAKNQT